MEKVSQSLKLLLSIGLFLAGSAIIGFGWYQIYQWYLGLSYLPGVDFYLTVTHVRQLLDNLNLPPLVWKYYWYSGYPFSLGYVILHFYLILPFAKFWGLIRGTQIFSMISLLFFAFSCYFLYIGVAKNKIFSAILAVATLYSASLYGALIWAGAVPSFATQPFLPLTLFFLVIYFQKEKWRWLFGAGLSLGLSILGHPRVFLLQILPISVFFIALFPYGEGKFYFLRRIKDAFVFYLVAFLVGIIQIYPLLIRTLQSLYGAMTQTALVATEAAKGTTTRVVTGHPKLIVVGTNMFIFYALVVFVAFFLLRLILGVVWRKGLKKALMQLLPTLLSLAFLVLYIYALAAGYPVLRGGWYRTFWPVPVMFGLLTAQLWGEMRILLGKVQLRRVKMIQYLVELIFILLSAGLVYYFSQGMTEELKIYTHTRKLGDPLASVSANKYGAYPYYLNIHFSDEELARLKEKFVPSWFEEATREYRFYEPDQTINIWWNALYNTSLALGYIDPPFVNQGYWFWMRQAINDEGLVENWEKSEIQALNNAKFLIDWHGIGVIEYGCSAGRVYCLKISKYLLDEGVVKDPSEMEVPAGELLISKIAEYEPGEIVVPSGEKLIFYRVDPDLASPILQPLDTTNVLVVSNEEGFELLVRALAYNNLNSRKLVLVRDTQSLDKLSLAELKEFKAVILYNYQYKDKRVWDNLLDRYVKEGGRVLIETGSEVKDSESEDLPSLFPMEKSHYEPLGENWGLESYDFAQQIDIGKFSPPIYEDYPWKFSFVGDDNDLYSGAKVILRNHGRPVLLEKDEGAGKVIWSGLNLPYHLNRYDNYEEVKLFEEILSRLTHFQGVDYRGGEYSAKFENEWAKIEGNSAPLSILFREQAFPGWKAKITSGGKTENLKIYRAGPIIPGFIYVVVPQEMRGKPYQVTFHYDGDPRVWLFFFISVGAILFAFEKVVVGGKVTRKISHKLFSRMSRRIKEHWESEEI